MSRPLQRAKKTYDKLCAGEMAQHNTMSAAVLLADALCLAPEARTILGVIHDAEAPITTEVLSHARGVSTSQAGSYLLQLLDVELIRRDAIRLARGGRRWVYTLTPLGEHVMQHFRPRRDG